MRLIMNPTFSSAKIKEMGPLIVKCIDRLTVLLDNKNDVEINITNYLKRFTMDTIWNCAFGLDIDLQNDLQNDYFLKSEAIFKTKNSKTTNMAIILSAIMPELNFFLDTIRKRFGQSF